jgi:molecular chaperone Hsp33
MLIQKMPPKSDNSTGPDNLTGSNDYKESHDEDAWSRVIQLSETIKPEELLELDSETIVYRLFHEEDVKIFEEQQVSFHCSCTRSRTDAMLVTLGKTEIKQVLAEEGEISIQCEFCNEVYRYDAIDVEKLFIDNLVEPSENRHH